MDSLYYAFPEIILFGKDFCHDTFMKKLIYHQREKPDYLIRQKKLSTIKTAISFAAAIYHLYNWICNLSYQRKYFYDHSSSCIAAGKQKYGVHDHVFKDTGL